MINAERILRVLDERLDHEVSLVIYGRAAVALGSVIPDLAELREAFERAKPRVREIVRRGGLET